MVKTSDISTKPGGPPHSQAPDRHQPASRVHLAQQASPASDVPLRGIQACLPSHRRPAAVRASAGPARRRRRLDRTPTPGARHALQVASHTRRAAARPRRTRRARAGTPTPCGRAPDLRRPDTPRSPTAAGATTRGPPATRTNRPTARTPSSSSRTGTAACGSHPSMPRSSSRVAARPPRRCSQTSTGCAEHRSSRTGATSTRMDSPSSTTCA